MPSREEGEASADPLALLAALVRNLELLAEDGDAAAAETCLHAQQALQRARAERADGLQQAASILQAEPPDALSGALER
jgi:hypothetical protein